jgi:midasin
MEGALAKAVRAGRWVVLDDIDRAGMEMLVTVAQLARSLKPGRTGRRGKLQVPGRPDIEAGDGFALFATRSTRPDAHTPAFFGHHHFTEVTLNAPTEDDILAILSAQFGRVPAGVIATLVRVWQALRPLARIPGPVKPREIGLRDLEKWCARVQRNLPIQATIDALQGNPLGLFANPVFQDEVLLEAVDVFMASFDSKPTSLERKAGMIAVVAEAIGMDDERAMALIDKRRPTLEVSTRQLLIGRTVTPLAPAERKKSKVTSENRPYALTKPSLVLLERVAASTALAEPTLLVGETGTGKTTAVQYIANAAGKPLTVLNLSMQTESSDLLGGFKPIDASASARLLHAKWQKLFIDTFSMAKPANGTYLEIAAKALAGRKWARCAELWSSSAKKALDKLVKKDDDAVEDGSSTPRKKRKTNMRAAKAAVAWQALMVEIADFDLHHVKGNSKLVFSFIEGPLVKAIQSGEWYVT